MAVRKESAVAAMSPRLKALKATDISPLIRMAGLVLPRVLDGFLASLDKRQRSAVDRVMPASGGKKIYLQLVGTPTPPIVIRIAQPVQMGTMSENEVRRQRIRGIRLTIDDIQLLTKGRTPGNILKLLWRLKGQTLTILAILWMFAPLLRLGPSGLRDMGNKMTSRSKPLLELLARPKK